jgi:hypothetical protein
MSEPKQESFADLATPGPRRGERPMPDGAKLDHCKSCGADIVWARTEGEKAIPLSVATSQQRGGITYLLPHWVDCKDADQWRKKGRR